MEYTHIVKTEPQPQSQLSNAMLEHTKAPRQPGINEIILEHFHTVNTQPQSQSPAFIPFGTINPYSPDTLPKGPISQSSSQPTLVEDKIPLGGLPFPSIDEPAIPYSPICKQRVTHLVRFILTVFSERS